MLANSIVTKHGQMSEDRAILDPVKEAEARKQRLDERLNKEREVKVEVPKAAEPVDVRPKQDLEELLRRDQDFKQNDLDIT